MPNYVIHLLANLHDKSSLDHWSSKLNYSSLDTGPFPLDPFYIFRPSDTTLLPKNTTKIDLCVFTSAYTKGKKNQKKNLFMGIITELYSLNYYRHLSGNHKNLVVSGTLNIA